MALSGSIVQNVGSRWRVVLEWTATQSVANNQSYVNAKMYWESFDAYGKVNSTATKEVAIQYNNGAWDIKTAAGLAGLSAYQKKLIHEKNFTINHNLDGTASFSLDGYFDVNVTLSGVYYGRIDLAQQNFTLNTIPRSSTPTLNDYHVWYGDSFIIYTNRASSSFTHRLRYNFSGNIGTIATGVTTSYTWVLPTSFMNYIPNATIDNGTIYCDTYDSGGSLIGTKTVTMKGYVPSNVIPTITSVNATEYYQAYKDFMASTAGPYIQGKSKINMTVSNPTGAYGSTIESFIYTVDGKTYTVGNGVGVSNYIYGSGSLTLTGKIKDSRGRESTIKSTILSVLPYQAPKVTNFIIQRANLDGTLNDLGDYAKVTRAGTWSDLGLRNNVDITLRSKARGTTTWATKDTLAAGTSGNHSDVITVGTYAVISSFDFRLDLVDQFNTTLSLAVLSTGLVTMSWGKEGVGIGKVWEEGTLDVGGRLISRGRQQVKNPSGTELEALTEYFVQGVRKGWIGFGSTGNQEDIYFLSDSGHVTLYPATGKEVILANDARIRQHDYLNFNFYNGWGHYQGGTGAYGTARFYKTTDNEVVFEGLIEGTTSGSSTNEVIRLPSGYRPEYRKLFAQWGARVDITAGGYVHCDTAGTVSLDGVRFRVPS